MKSDYPQMKSENIKKDKKNKRFLGRQINEIAT